MKYIFILSFVFTSLLSSAQHKLEKLWETDTVVAIPESVLPDYSKNILYVSLIDGGGWDADGKGGIGRLGMDGKKYDGSWISGLNAPKGLGVSGNWLYAADISDVVVVDMSKGKIEKKIPIDSAKGLNDITVDAKGVVYVSDSRTAKIWRIENGKPTLFLDNIRGVNGLKAIGNDLYIGAGKTFMKSDMKGNKTVLAELPQGIDGIEPIGNGDFILTAWNGYIFYIPAKGNFEILLDSHIEKMNTADIGYDVSKKIVYVPTFNAKKVVAYRLVSSSDAKPSVFLMDAAHLNNIKTLYEKNSNQARQLVDRIRKQADSYLNFIPVSVTQKQLTPVSGSKHDYMSQAPYFWYDSSKPNGLPYLRKDGVRNPEINKITDHKNMGDLENATRYLSLAWYFTKDEKYASKASQLLNTWFFDEKTRMNPNLEYAQGIPGINNGRGIGIIESRSLTGIADAAGLLSGSKSWTTADMKKLKDWYSQYLEWMLNSKNGKDEHAAKNNHGTWYFVQAMYFALFTGNQAKAVQLAEEARQRLDSQLLNDGRQPLELDRTKALGYSTMNLRGWFEAARLADQVGVDLWNFKTSKDASLQMALDWLLPYATGEKEFAYQQIEKYNTMELYPLLLQAANQYKDERYLMIIKEMIKGSDPLSDLLFGK